MSAICLSAKTPVVGSPLWPRSLASSGGYNKWMHFIFYFPPRWLYTKLSDDQRIWLGHGTLNQRAYQRRRERRRANGRFDEWNIFSSIRRGPRGRLFSPPFVCTCLNGWNRKPFIKVAIESPPPTTTDSRSRLFCLKKKRSPIFPCLFPIVLFFTRGDFRSKARRHYAITQALMGPFQSFRDNLRKRTISKK